MITADEFRDARESVLRMTQLDMAKRLDVSQRTIVNWEAHGVPDRAERRVLMDIGSAIKAVRETNEYRAFLDTPAGAQALEEQRKEHDEDERSFGGAFVHSVQESDVVRNAIATEGLSDLDLLHELVRRRYDPRNERLDYLKTVYRSVANPENVGGSGDDDDLPVASTEDVRDRLKKSDVALAAKRGRKITEQ